MEASMLNELTFQTGQIELQLKDAIEHLFWAKHATRRMRSTADKKFEKDMEYQLTLLTDTFWNQQKILIKLRSLTNKALEKYDKNGKRPVRNDYLLDSLSKLNKPIMQKPRGICSDES